MQGAGTKSSLVFKVSNHFFKFYYVNRENNVFLKIFDILVEFLPYFKKKKLKKFVECKDDVFGEPYI